MENTTNDLLENPQELMEQYRSLQRELDTANQDLYDCRRQLRTVEALEKEYLSEIEALQSEGNAEKQKLSSTVARLQDDIISIRIIFGERISSLESDLYNRGQENEKLQSEVELLRKGNVIQEIVDDDSKLLDEIEELKEENRLLSSNVDELKDTLEEYQKQNALHQEKIQFLDSELEALKESLKLKKEELDEAREQVTFLQDENFCMKNELETLKSKPLEEKSKGNSLFSEVDDRRVQLQSTVNTMKSKYVEMKRQRNEHLKLINHLRNENAVLCQRWEADYNQKAEDYDMVEEALKRRIRSLEEMLNRYKKDLAEKPAQISESSGDSMKFFNSMMNMKKKEIEDLRERIGKLSFGETTLTMDLTEARQEARKWRLKASQFEIEVNQLKSEIQEMVSAKNEKALEENINAGLQTQSSQASNVAEKENSRPSLLIKSCLKNKGSLGVRTSGVGVKEESGKLRDISNTQDKYGTIIEINESCSINEAEEVQCVQDNKEEIDRKISDVNIRKSRGSSSSMRVSDGKKVQFMSDAVPVDKQRVSGSGLKKQHIPSVE